MIITQSKATPLMTAADFGSVSCVKMLVESGAKVNKVANVILIAKFRTIGPLYILRLNMAVLNV